MSSTMAETEIYIFWGYSYSSISKNDITNLQEKNGIYTIW